MRSTIGSFGPFSQPSVWDQPPLRHSSATHSAQMQQCRRACAKHRGPATPLANSQLSTHDRLSGTHTSAGSWVHNRGECSSGGSEVLVARLQVAVSARRPGRSAEPLNQISISVGSAAGQRRPQRRSGAIGAMVLATATGCVAAQRTTGPEERTWLTSATSTTARPRSGRPSTRT